jgi:NADPH-dependent 2,4-dienoyl-CoA reductase/sulfur reductase-like enzyme
VPNVVLAQALGCEMRGGGVSAAAAASAGESAAIAVDDTQRTSLEHVFAAGECTGIGGMELAAVEGSIAGLAASGSSSQELRPLRAQRARWQRFAARVDTAFALGDLARTPPPDDTLLCRCEDVTYGAVRAHTNWRDAKLHTRCGMGACQGRICGTAAAVYFGWDAAQPRPPFSPAQIATLIEAAPQPANVD